MTEDRSKAISLADFGRDILRRRAEYEAKYGPLDMPRNSGNRRTPSKRALLKAIEEAGGKWYRVPGIGVPELHRANTIS